MYVLELSERERRVVRVALRGAATQPGGGDGPGAE